MASFLLLIGSAVAFMNIRDLQLKKQSRPLLTVPVIAIFVLAFVMNAAASAGISVQSVPSDDGLDPGVLFGVLFLGAVLLVLVGIGIAIGLACLACAAIFVALGVISSSALVAIAQRRFSAGLRALHYQVLALVGLPAGISAFGFACLLFDVHIRHRYVVIIGSAVGIAAGIIVAFTLDRFFRFLIRRLLSRQDLAHI